MTPCVETEHRKDPDGYGRCRVMRHGRRINKRHVLVWVDYHGRLPAPGMQINHACDNRGCEALLHLYEGTQADNVRDMVQRGRLVNPTAESLAAKNECVNHHVFTKENTHIRPNGTRQCRACHRDVERARYHRAQVS